MNEVGDDKGQPETTLLEAGNPKAEAALDTGVRGSHSRSAPPTRDRNIEEDSEDEGLGVDPILTLLNRRYPRVALHRDTLRLL